MSSFLYKHIERNTPLFSITMNYNGYPDEQLNKRQIIVRYMPISIKFLLLTNTS